MKILFIGGTKFVGRNLVAHALKSGHEVEILQRGKTHSNIFPDVKRYFGDRLEIAQKLSSAQSESYWDVVIDTCGYHPLDVETSGAFLKDRCRKYIFISTISVFSEFSKPGLTEDSELLKLSVPLPERGAPITYETYGPLKVLCEKQLQKDFKKEQLLIIRPGIIVGPYDDTQRFDYWIKAALTQNEVEAPHDPEAPVQFIDVRALSEFVIKAAEENKNGVFNLVGPFEKLSFMEWLKLIQKTLNPQLQYQWKDPKSYSQNQKPAPLFVPPEMYGLFQINAEKAYKAGLPKLSAVETIQAVADFIKPDLKTIQS